MAPSGSRSLHEQRPTGRLVGDVAAALRQGVRDEGLATLCLAGCGIPPGTLAALAAEALEWERVFVTVPEDAWVVSDHRDSCEGAVRRALRAGAARGARVVPLYGPGRPEDAAARWQPPAFAGPFDAVVLAVGDDGAVGALRPGARETREALQAPADRSAVVAPGQPTRLLLTGPRLAWTRHLALVAPTPAAARVVDAAARAELPTEHPVRWLLDRPDTPLVVYRAG